MSNIKTVLQNAITSELSNARLQDAALLAASYNLRRDNDAAAATAAAQFAAELLGVKATESVKTGQATAKGLESLAGKDPIKTCLVAVAKQDRELKRSLFWGLDAARRAAAVEAYRAATAAATAVEAAQLAMDIMGDEPYAGAEESALYPESGHAARGQFEDDSVVWEALSLLLGQGGDRTAKLCRFWHFDGADFIAVYCDEWADVEAFLAPKN
jgi:hypothetical protein